MNPPKKSPALGANEEIPALIETLLATEQRLEELTGGEVDTVAGRDGRTFLLRRAQEQLRYSDAAKQAATLNELQLLFDLMPAMVWFKDTEDRILRVNQRVADIAGKSIAEIEGKPSSENYPQEAARHYQDDLEIIHSGKPKMGIVETIRDRNGDEVWIQTDKVPYCDADGKVIGVVVMAQDITERRRTDEKLRASEERFRLLAKATNDAIWDWDLVTDALWWNDGIEKLFGYRRETVVPTIRSWTDCIHPKDLARVTEAIHHAIKGGFDVWTDEYRFRCQDGSYAYVLDRGYIIRDGAGQGVRMIGGMTDLTERKRIEESLRASEANMAIAQRIAHFGSWELDLTKAGNADAKVLRWSDEMFRIAGYEPGAVEVSSELFFRLVHPEDREPIRQAVATAIRERREYSIVHRLIRPDGETRMVQETAQIFFDETTGQPLKVVGTAHDITERKRDEEALRESEERFAGAFAHAPIGVALVSPDGRWLKGNRSLCDLVGYSEAELQTRTVFDLTHPEDVELSRENVRRAIAGEARPIQVEKRYIHKRGHFITALLNISLVRDSQGQPRYFIAQLQDITERKRNETRFRRLVDSNAQGVFFWNRKGDITGGNDAFLNIVGFTREDLEAGRIDWVAMTPPEYAHLDRDALVELARTGVCRSYEKTWVRKDGTLVPILLGAAMFEDNPDDGVCFVLDITERKRSEAELDKAHQELVKASRKAGMAEVATGILHNVGNVLNSVNVASSCIADSIRKSKAANLGKVVGLLREHEADLGDFLTVNPQGKQIPGYLAQLAEHLVGEQVAALQELAHLQKNIEHIKEIVAMQQGVAKNFGVKERLSVTEIVEDALKMNADALAREGIVVLREFQPVPLVMVEKHQVMQILVNLVRNAQQACEGTAPPEKRLTLRVTHGEGRIRIGVADNGLGILPEHLPRIFTHGFTTKKSGHGFGLNSSALAAKEMGGALTVHSDGPGQGATFTLELPCPTQEITHE